MLLIEAVVSGVVLLNYLKLQVFIFFLKKVSLLQSY